MIVDYKPKPDAQTRSDTLPRPPEASTSERKLAIELPNQRQIYTAGSPVAGIVRLGSKELERIQEIQVSLVCVVRSIHHRNYGQSQDIRRETTQLVHRDQTLWSSDHGGNSIPPVDLPFEIILPDVGNDRRASDPNTPLPPSFHAGKRRGLRNIMTPGTPIGFIKYYVKVSVMRRGVLARKERVIAPFIFLPPSPPPPFLPTLPESISIGSFCLPNDTWYSDNTRTTLKYAIFGSIGQARLELWMPRVPNFPRLAPIPFFLCLTLETKSVGKLAVGEPQDDVLPPAPQLEKASVFLRQTIQSCARRARQSHIHTFDVSPTDNMLHGITPEESAWTAKNAYEEQKQVGYWEKQFVWRGLWTFRETPNFTNRQLSWEYALVAEVPVKGLGNLVKLVSRTVEVSSGVTQGSTLAPGCEDMVDLPPDYFENDYDHADEEEKP